MAHMDRSAWSHHLPIILLAFRATPKEDLQCTPSELVFDTTLRLPGEMVTISTSSSPSSEFVSRLQEHMSNHSFTPPRKSERATQIPNDLSTCTHVFVRVDSVRPALQHPYDGPYRVISRQTKYFTVEKSGRQDTISIDRLKPAFLPPTKCSCK